VVERSGGLAAVDAAGVEVFVSPTPLMWDSSNVLPEVRGPAMFDVPAPDAQVDGSVGPPLGAKVAAMPVDLVAGDVVVTPDAEMLSGQGVSWPLYIDPTWDGDNGVNVNDYAMIQSGFGGDDPNFENWTTAGVGLCDVQEASTCNQDSIQRLIWEFNFPAGIHNATVTSAEFSAFKTHAFACNQTGWIRLYRVNSISATTTWDNHHAHWDDGGTAPGLDSQPGNGSCTGWENWNATAGAQSAATNSWATLTLGLRAKVRTTCRRTGAGSVTMPPCR
jgi:hypothetical protein